MTRQSYYTDPSRKHIEVYKDFSGGLNTVTSNDNLKDNELTGLINQSLGERGSTKRRHGCVSHLVPPVSGKGQGFFRYYKADGTFEEIEAINGKLYKDGVELAITGLTSFQTTRLIEAVQYENSLYIATGTKLVEYDGTTAKVVTPYTPEPLEALYIGTNGLADDPDNYLSDGTGAVLSVVGVTYSLRYGVVNKATTFTAFVSKPSGMTVEYMFEYREKDATTWVEGKAWSTSKTWNFTPSKTTDYEIRVKARDQATPTTEKEYYIPQYTVKQTDENKTVDVSTIHTCNRIILHWERLIIYGDTTQGSAIFISHLKNPRYFPTVNSLEFKNERREPLTVLKRFRDMIVAFTDTSIQALFGKSPQDFARVTLHTGLGCIAPESAQVVGNYIAFLSREGVHILKSVGYTEQRLNVEKIDNNVKNLVEITEDACAIVEDSQYQILFPNVKRRLRFYYEQNWICARDESEKLDFSRFYAWDGFIYGQSQTTGEVLKFDPEVWDDAGYVYQDIFESKYFDFGEPYHQKKLKELQLLISGQPTDTNLSVTVFADSSQVLSPDKSYASVVDGNVVWNTVNSPNVSIDAGTVFGSWELGESSWGNAVNKIKKLRIAGRCTRVKVRIIHEEATPNQFLGLAFIFKSKKP